MKVAVLGAAGGIGQALALLLKTQLPSGSELSLYDIAPVTPGVAVDLSHIPTAVKIKGFSGEDARPALQGADVVLISAGVARKPGMDRSDLFNVNAGIVKNLVQQIAEVCPKACIGIITNPVNTTVAIAAEVLKKAGVYDKNKLFGVTTLDIIRSNTFVAELKGKQPTEVEVPVIGGHSGVTILPLLSQIPGVSFTEQEVADLTKRIQNAGTEVVEAKAGGGSATLSMGQAAARFGLSLVRALQGEKGVVECAYVEGDGEHARFFSQPLLLGKNGIEERKSIGTLSAFEQHAMEGMLDTLKKDITLGMHRRNFTATDTDITADHASVADQLIHNFGRQLERNGKADPFRRLAVVTLIEREGVDAHQFAQRVDQRTAGVTVVDGGIGLQEVLPSGWVEANTPGRTDNPLGDGLAQVVRVTNRQDDVTNMRGTFTVDRDDRQTARGVNLQDGEVSQAVRANE